MKREVKPTVSFYLRSNKQKQGKSPIMLRVSFNRERKSFGQVGLSIDPSPSLTPRVYFWVVFGSFEE